MDLGISEKKALITGGTKGIGFKTAEMLMEEGVEVTILGRTRESASAAAKKLGPACQWLAADVSDMVALREAVGEREFDILVASAGIVRTGELHDASNRHWGQVIGANVRGLANSIEICLPAMLRGKWGRITIFGSYVGSKGRRDFPLYSLSKGAARALVESVGDQHAATGVTVNNIAPGYVDTAMTENGDREAMAAEMPIQRMISCEEAAAQAVWYSSKYVGAITRHTTIVGGM